MDIIKTITICGSMRFARKMRDIAWELEAHRGFNVIQCVYNDKNEFVTEDMQERLTKAHYKKIDISDGIYVVDIDGYIGLSVEAEILYARERKKELIFHSKQKKQYK